MKPIAICKNDKMFKHSTNWNNAFVKFAEQLSIEYEIVNPYENGFIDKTDRYSAVIWPIQNYVLPDILEARNILNIIEKKGIIVFPNHNTSWHFDDKIAESYLLKSINAPIPNFWVFYSREDALKWIKNAKYPFIAKLKSGSGSNNVAMIKNQRKAIKYVDKMFSRGVDPSPSLLYKAYSKTQSSKNIGDFFSRIRRIPEFLNTLKHAKQFSKERGYCYFQEFIPNDGYDVKLVVVNNKIGAFYRKTRKGDFRASGGGDVYFEKPSNEIIKSALEIANKLKMQSVGFDYVVDNITGEGKIIEMCYGFDWEVMAKANGYWDKSLTWHESQLIVPFELLSEIKENVLNKIENRVQKNKESEK